MRGFVPRYDPGHEADRERPQPLLPRCQSGNDGAVDARRQKHGDRHVGDEVVLHGACQGGAHRDNGLVFGDVLANRNVVPETLRPAGTPAMRVVRHELLPRSRRKGADIGKQRSRLLQPPEGEIPAETVLIETSAHEA